MRKKISEPFPQSLTHKSICKIKCSCYLRSI